MSAARRLVAATGAGILALLTVAPPASAAAPPNVQWTRPSLEDKLLEQPGPITGMITTKPEDNQDIKGLSVVVNSVPPSDDPEDPCFVEQPGAPDVGGPNATFEVDVAFPCNGVYEMSAVVTYDEPFVGGLSRTEKMTEPPAIEFSVAIPPDQVRGLDASYDAGTREVRLTWTATPDPAPDFLGYVVERDPPGRDPFVPIGRVSADKTSFIDPEVGQENRYQVRALRRGATPDVELMGEPSLRQSAGPEAPEPTVPEAPPPNPSNSGGSGSGGDQPGKSSGASRPPSRTRPTTDTGFEQALPFDPSQTTTIPPDDSATGPPGDAAVLAEFDDAVSDEEQQRATLVPVAGGLALIVGALHLFLLSKRAGESDIPIVPR